MSESTEQNAFADVIDKLAVTSKNENINSTLFTSKLTQTNIQVNSLERPEEPPASRTKRRRSNWEGNECIICGDRASGYHYNVLSCEGCKGFYRRVVTDPNKVFICKFHGNCKMDLYWRRKCPACRLKKCKQVGMKPEFVLNKVKSIKKRVKVTEKEPPYDKKHYDKRSSEIKHAFIEYQKPIDQEMNTSGPEYIHDLFTINVQRYAAFCKNIPEYCQLGEEDQIALFKGCITEASLLRSAQSYAEHPEKQLEQLARILRIIPASHPQLDRPVRHFYNRMSDIKPTPTEMGLLIAISLFSSERGQVIRQRQFIEETQTLFVSILEYECQRNQRRSEYPKLLLKLADLRYLQHAFYKIMANESSEPLLTPLLREIWEFK